jgi:hypothetical protein
MNMNTAEEYLKHLWSPFFCRAVLLYARKLEFTSTATAIAARFATVVTATAPTEFPISQANLSCTSELARDAVFLLIRYRLT